MSNLFVKIFFLKKIGLFSLVAGNSKNVNLIRLTLEKLNSLWLLNIEYSSYMNIWQDLLQ